MAEKYKEFDTSSIITSASDGISFRGHTFTKREIALAGAVLGALIVCVVLAALLGAANSKDGSSDGGPVAGGQTAWGATADNVCLTPLCLQSAAFVRSNLNEKINPCNNFYNYACGSYVQHNKLHPDYPSESVLAQVYRTNQLKLQNVLLTSTQRYTRNSAERKVKDFFRTCVDDYGRMKLKGNPFLKKVIPNVGGWYAIGTWNASNYDFMSIMKKVHIDYWTAAFFRFDIRTDMFDWTKNYIQIDLSGMGMPWEYYTRPDTQRLRNDYKKFIRNVGLQLVKDAKTNLTDTEITSRVKIFVEDAFSVEYQLANLTAHSKATKDPHHEKERVTLNELNAQTKSPIDWVDFFTYTFDQAEVTGSTKVVVLEKDYITRLSGLINGLGENSSRIINNYYIWRLSQHYVQELSWEYIHANRDYYVDIHNNANFQGTWRYCMNLVNNWMPQAISSLFVRDHFVDKNKDKAMEIVDYLKTSLIESIMNSSWIDEITKTLAKNKLTNSLYKLGYPEFIMNDDNLDTEYASLEIVPKDHFANILNFNKFFKKRVNDAIQHGTDKTKWRHRTFDTVAEYYNPWSELIVPAGMLQFPIYDHQLPHYINFGSIGSLISHRLLHAIDEFGREYKMDGTWFGAWWTNQTTKRYTDIKQCVIDTYRNKTQGPFQLATGPRIEPINAQRYSPEALAETSGVRIAYHAYKDWTKQQTNNEKQIPGVSNSHDQMFFVSYAQANCFNRVDAYAWSQAIRGTVLEDTKINMAVSQLTEFQDAFNCKAGDEMVAKKKCVMY